MKNLLLLILFFFRLSLFAQDSLQNNEVSLLKSNKKPSWVFGVSPVQVLSENGNFGYLSSSAQVDWRHFKKNQHLSFSYAKSILQTPLHLNDNSQYHFISLDKRPLNFQDIAVGYIWDYRQQTKPEFVFVKRKFIRTANNADRVKITINKTRSLSVGVQRRHSLRHFTGDFFSNLEVNPFYPYLITTSGYSRTTYTRQEKTNIFHFGHQWTKSYNSKLSQPILGKKTFHKYRMVYLHALIAPQPKMQEAVFLDSTIIFKGRFEAYKTHNMSTYYQNPFRENFFFNPIGIRGGITTIPWSKLPLVFNFEMGFNPGFVSDGGKNLRESFYTQFKITYSFLKIR